MARDAVLVLGRRRDPHARAVRDELRRRGRAVHVVDPRTYPVAGWRSYAIGPGTPPAWTDSEVDLGSIGVAWSAEPRTAGLSPGLVAGSRRFARAAALQAAESFLRGAPFPWINPYDAAVRADDKLLQLAEARRLGFAIPDTLVTNDAAAVRAFARRHRSLVAKSISGSHGLPDDRRVLTNVVTAADLQRADDVRHAPVCFQEYVPKRSELRVTVIGGRAHAVRIHSQESRRTRHDWRHYDPGLRYSVAQLPAPTARRCTRLAARLGLDYGGIDLVERPDGEHVFLEINTRPAWLWLEDATGHPLTAAFADHVERRLARGR